MSDRKTLSINLKHYRYSCNLSQENLAEKTGLSRNYISDLENSKCNPSLETLTSLANSLHIDTYLLLKPIESKAKIAKRIDIFRKRKDN